MTNKKMTLRALIASLLALLFSVTSLIGTTFAWFTDNVTNGANKIVSGNLDVELWHSTYFDSAENSTFGVGFGYSEAAGEQVDSETLLFLNQDGEQILWEPGATAVENFRIKNVGDLSLKFQFKLEVANATKTPEGRDLTEILDLYIDEINWEGDTPVGTTITVQKLGDGYMLEGELMAGETYDFWVGLEWEPSDIDNEFNVPGGLSLDLGVILVATQFTYEKDGYNGNGYDGDAFYADNYAAGADTLEAGLANGGTTAIIDDLTFSASETASNSGYGATGITVNGGAILDGNGNILTVNDANGSWDCAVNPQNGTVKNLTVNGAFRGIFMGSATGDVYIDNVTIDKVCYTFNSDGGNRAYGVYISNSTLNGWTSYSNVHKEVVFTDCKFGAGTGAYNYAFCRPYNASVFENCVFEVGYEFDTSKTSDIVFKNCYYGDTLITADNAASLQSDDGTVFFYNGLNGITIE